MTTEKRFVAFDVHKSYVMVAAVNFNKDIILKPRRVNFTHFETRIAKNLRPTDETVLEATTNAWHIHDLLVDKVARVVVAHPYHVKLIAAAAIKTDKRDTLTLARLLAANMIPEVWVPPQAVRDLRALIAHRQRLVSQRTAAKNRLQSVLHRRNLLPPVGSAFSKDNHEWWLKLDLPSSEKLRIKQDLTIINYLNPLLDEVEAELKRLSVADPWRELVPFLIQLPGIGLIKAMTILSAIGEIERFASAKKLVGYAGLGSRVHASGKTYHTGSITKQGRKELRSAMVEAAWSAVRSNTHWQEEFERLRYRLGDKKAIVAIGRKLLVVVWHVLTKKEADKHALPEKVAAKMQLYGWQLGPDYRDGLTPGQFIRYQLLTLNLGHDLDAIYPGGVKRLIPPAAEVLALKPELHQVA